MRYKQTAYAIGIFCALWVVGIAFNTKHAIAMDPRYAAGLSLLFPGSGQMVYGEYASGGLQMAANVQALVYQAKLQDISDEEKDQGETYMIEEINATTYQLSKRANKYRWASAFQFNFLSMFSAYDAYRIGRQNPEYASSYKNTPAPQETFTDLLIAPVNWRYFTRWTTLVPMAVILASAASDRTDDEIYFYPSKQDKDFTVSDIRKYQLITHWGVGIGEEALFRGVINTEFSEQYGENMGMILSSLAFGLAHTGTQGSANAIGASLAGLYFSWLHQRNGYNIGEGVAIHAWNNIAASYKMTRERPKDTKKRKALAAARISRINIPLVVYVKRF